ncbi:MAG: lipocalin-like domain-containing protein [Marinosulfonomonas sp.]|nr:lipocalin-like domain-containing protein [Marinosulfonomonas sp.]
MALNPEDIVGLWNLVSWVQHRGPEDNFPMGEDPIGRFIYTPEGQMAAHIMRRDRPVMTTGDFVTGSTEEKAASFGSFMGYCGDYEIDGDTVYHDVKVSSYPNWTGQKQSRTATLKNGLLVLSAAPRIVNGVSVTADLTWRR